MNIDSSNAPTPTWTALFLAWLIASLATAGALLLGEVMDMTPCVLCWYQRIAMFPLVVVLGVGCSTLITAACATRCRWRALVWPSRFTTASSSGA